MTNESREFTSVCDVTGDTCNRSLVAGSSRSQLKSSAKRANRQTPANNRPPVSSSEALVRLLSAANSPGVREHRMFRVKRTGLRIFQSTRKKRNARFGPRVFLRVRLYTIFWERIYSSRCYITCQDITLLYATHLAYSVLRKLSVNREVRNDNEQQ